MQVDGRALRGEKTRDKILKAALILLRDGDEKDFSASALAVKAGVSKGVLFHHFKTVDDVPFILAQQMLDQALSKTTGPPNSSVDSLLSTLGASLFEASDKDKKIGRVFLRYYLRSHKEARFRNLLEIIITNFAENLEKEILLIVGRNKASRAKSLSLIISMCFEGLGIYNMVYSDKKKLKEAWETFSKIIRDLFEVA